MPTAFPHSLFLNTYSEFSYYSVFHFKIEKIGHGNVLNKNTLIVITYMYNGLRYRLGQINTLIFFCRNPVMKTETVA